MGVKGKLAEKKKRQEEEEAKKREDEANRLVQEAENWLRTKEEEKKRAAEEAAKKAKEKRKKQEDEIRKKQADSEGFRLEGVQKEKQQTEKALESSRIEILEGQDPIDQEQDQTDSNPLEPVVPSSGTAAEGSGSFFWTGFNSFHAYGRGGDTKFQYYILR